MYRIDNDSAVATLPVAPPAGIAGFFTGGNPSVGLLATKLDFWWANMVQEEILAVVTAAGITPSKTDNRQLLEALGALYLGHAALAGYLPLAGGTMTGYPLLLARDPVLSMEAATRQFVLAQVGGVTPTGFLPLTGGTLHYPGHSGPLTIQADQGTVGGITYIVTNIRQWFGGILTTGVFQIGDQTSGRTWNFNVDGSMSIPGVLQIGGQGVQYNGLPSGTNNIGFTWNAGQLVAYINGSSIGALVPGNFLPITGGTLTGSLTISGSNNLSVGGTGYFSSNLSTAGNINVSGDYTGHAITASGGITVNAGGVNVQAGGLSVNGNINSGDITGHLFTVSGGITVTAGGVNIQSGGLSIGADADTHIAGNLLVNGSTNLFGSTAMHADASVTGPLSALSTVNVSSSGSFGGLLQANAGLQVNNGDINVTTGNAYKPGDGQWGTYSSIEIKKNVEDYTRGLAVLRRLRPVTYQYNGLFETPDNGRTYHGIVAEEALEVMPELYVENVLRRMHPEDEELTPIAGINSTPIIYALINAVKELAAKVEALEAR